MYLYWYLISTYWYGPLYASTIGESLVVCGRLLSSYTGISSSLGKMKEPRHIAVDERGRLLVADKGNNRLLVLDQSLSSAREMPVSAEGGLNAPWISQGQNLVHQFPRNKSVTSR